MSNKFIDIDRKTPINLPGEMEGWLDRNSLARFVVEVVEQLDTQAIEERYRGSGSAPYPPKMMLALIFYCYAKGIYSSRKMEKASYELIPVLYITGGTHPDHDSINTFRKRFLEEMSSIFVQILEYACNLGIFKLGEISMDGSKFKANASKHKAMSWDYAGKIEEQLKAEVEALLDKAESGLGESSRDIDIPQELKRREERLKKIAQIKAEIEQRAAARYKQEKAEFDRKMAERAAKEQERGRKIGGKKPKEPEPGPQGKDQVNFTDGESRIMPTSGGGFEQAYNAQASVDMVTMLIVGNHVSQNPNDKQEVEPALAELDKLPENLGKVEKAALDSGFFSEHNTQKFVDKDIEPYIASGRQNHYPTWSERFAAPPTPPQNPDEVAAMKHRLKTDEGKEFYAKRKSTVEPVFGIIKEVMGFRRFMLRGLQSVTGEWTLVCIAFNLKRLFALSV
jgi:transposase